MNRFGNAASRLRGFEMREKHVGEEQVGFPLSNILPNRVGLDPHKT
jgi:hypothetical protein